MMIPPRSLAVVLMLLAATAGAKKKKEPRDPNKPKKPKLPKPKRPPGWRLPEQIPLERFTQQSLCDGCRTLVEELFLQAAGDFKKVHIDGGKPYVPEVPGGEALLNVCNRQVYIEHYSNATRDACLKVGWSQ